MLTLAWVVGKLEGGGIYLPESPFLPFALAPVLDIKRFSHLIGRKIKSELIKTLEWQQQRQQSKPALYYIVPTLSSRPKSLSINKLFGFHFSSWRMAHSSFWPSFTTPPNQPRPSSFSLKRTNWRLETELQLLHLRLPLESLSNSISDKTRSQLQRKGINFSALPFNGPSIMRVPVHRLYDTHLYIFNKSNGLRSIHLPSVAVLVMQQINSISGQKGSAIGLQLPPIIAF